MLYYTKGKSSLAVALTGQRVLVSFVVAAFASQVLDVFQQAEASVIPLCHRMIDRFNVGSSKASHSKKAAKVADHH